MKKLMLSLLGAATLAISSNAMALVQGRPFSVMLDRGALMDNAGMMMFAFNIDEGLFGGCGYVSEWDSAAMLPISGECYVTEAKTQGNFSCLSNSMMQVPSFVMVDSSPLTGLAPGMPACTGFDYFQQYRVVYMLMLAEDPTGFTGIISYTPATSLVYGIQLS